jgi:hypothetical protein
MRAFLLALAGVGVACSGRVSSIGDDGGTSSSSSGSTSSGGSSSGVVSSSSGGAGSNGGSTSSGGTGSNGGSTSSGGTGSNGGSTSSGGTGSNGGSTSSGGSSSNGGSTSGGGTTSSSSGGADVCSQLPPGACDEPPPAPTGPPTSISAVHDYAIHTLYLGDTDRQGVSNPNAWRNFGYDLDGKITTQASTDVCTLVAGASRAVQIDGNGGIDNSWGSNIVPILMTLNSTVSQTTNASIQAGGPTQLFYVVGFDDSAGNATTAAGLSGLTLATAQFANANPTWNASTHWPIAPEYMTNCTLSTGCPAGTDPVAAATLRFPHAFQIGGTFSTGSPFDLALQISMGGQPMTLTLHSAMVTFAPLAPGAVTNGTIAGVLDTQEFIAQLQQVAGRISTALCAGSAFQSIASQIEQTSDIVWSGNAVSNSAGTQCNAITIGLGFDATEIAVPVAADVTGPQAPPPNPCGDGG